jgi:hypothetical protein
LRRPSLLLLFLLHMATPRRGPTAAQPDDGFGSSRHHGSATPQAVQAPLASVGAGSSKGVTAWAQTPPRQRWRGPMTVGLDLGSTGLDLGSEVFFIFKNYFFVLADISSRHQSLIFWCQSTPTDIKNA